MGKPRLGRSPSAEDSGLGYAEELRTSPGALDQDLTHGARGNPLEVKMGEPSEPR